MSVSTLKILYIAFTITVMIFLLIIGFKAIDNTVKKKSDVVKKKVILLSGLLLWQAYIFVISNSGILHDFSFPPRFAVFLIIPLFIFTGLFLFVNRNKTWINTIPSHRLIFFQSFRIIVESIFVFTVAQGFLNKEVTIEGYNFDMIFGYTALLIGLLAYKKIVGRKFLLFWNYLGLIVIASIIFLFTSSIYNPQFFGSETILLPKQAVDYPYILIPGFLMPVAVFIHFWSIVQLRKLK